MAFAIASAPAVAGSIYTNNLIANYNFATDSFDAWNISNIWYDPGFYVPPASNGAYCKPNPNQYIDPDTGEPAYGCEVANTTVDAPGHDGVYSAWFGNLPIPPGGVTDPTLGQLGPALLDQTVATDPGTYTVQFWFRPLDSYLTGNPGLYIDPFTPTNGLDVTFAGQSIASFSNYGSTSPTWTKVSQVVSIGTSGTSTLSFSAWDQYDYLLVTDVAVCPGTCIEPPPPGTVPEPASVALLGAGLAMLVVSRRRRKR